MSLQSLRITKIDAARRQLETAIRLWLSSGDPISVHTLAAAAHQVLHDLGKKKGTPSILRELAKIRPEKRKQVRELLVKAENFLKHADLDPQQSLNFNPESTEIMLFDAVLTYEGLAGTQIPLLSTFKIWMFINKPEFMESTAREQVLKINPGLADDAKKFTKQQFFDLWLDVLRDLAAANAK